MIYDFKQKDFVQDEYYNCFCSRDCNEYFKKYLESSKEKFDYIKKVPLLLIDDIGAEGLTAYNRDEVLCPLLQYRMDNYLPTFFTSNLSLKELSKSIS